MKLRELNVFNLEKRRLTGNLLTVYSSLKEGCSQLGVGLFSQITKGRMKGNSPKFYQGKFMLDI